MLTTLIFVGLGIWVLPFAAVLVWVAADRVLDRMFPPRIDWPADTEAAINQALDVANSHTPIHDQLACDHFRRQLDHPDAASRIGEGA